jgi:hypothetical protein
MSELGSDTLSQMRTEVFGLLGEISTPGRQQKVDAALNRALERIAKEGHFPTLQRVDEVGLNKPSDTSTDTLKSGEAFYPLPWGCRDVQSIILHSPSGTVLEQLTAATLYTRYSVTATGTPMNYAIVGETVQHARLSVADTVVITGDATNNSLSTLRIWYRANDDYTGEVTSQLFDVGSTFGAGVTTSGTLAAGWPIERIAVNDKWIGDITITRTTGGTQLAKISGPFLPIAGNPMRRTLTRPLARVCPLPDGNLKATVIWRRMPQRLINPSDIPEIPVATSMVYAAAAEMLRIDRKFVQANVYEAKVSQALDGTQKAESPVLEIAPPMWGSFVEATGTDDL